MAQQEFAQHYPKAGYVEHDPMDIYASQISVLTEALLKGGVSPEDIYGIGITNQRETTIVWDKNTASHLQRHCMAVPPHRRGMKS